MPKSGSPPVVLVHGFLSPERAMVPMQRLLGRRGKVAYRSALPVLAVSDVRAQARCLDSTVQSVRAETGVQQVDLVGVSLGGITALWWLRKMGGYRHARRLVTIGTPFRGTPVARVGAAAFGWAGRAAEQCIPGSPLLQSLEGGSPIQTTSIAAAGDRIAPPSQCVLDGAAHVVLRGPRIGWLAHQWLVLHRGTLDAVVEALD